MPISYVVDPDARLVRTTCLGCVTLLDVAVYARALDDGKLLTYGQLIDAREATLALSRQDIRILGRLMAALAARHGRAPVAFVPGDEVSYRVARLYQRGGAGANTRFAILTDMVAAEIWLAIEALATAMREKPGRARRSS
jgi:hypothetical protein